MPDFDLGTARGKIEIDSSGVASGVNTAKGSITDLEGKSDKAQATLTKTGVALGGVGLAAVGGFALAVNAASDFETRLSAVKAVSGATTEQMEAIREKALQLGADTKFSASEAGSAIEELVKAGIPLEGVINGAADATVALAAAGEIDLPQAATIAANAMNQFGLAAADMPKIADRIAGAANASAIDVSDFGMSMSQAGATANLVGLSFDDMALAIAAMGNAGIKGSDAGTSLKTFLSNLQPTTKAQTTAMSELGLITEKGANAFFTAEGKIKDMATISGLLSDATKDLTEQEKAMTLETIFGSDAIRAAAVIATTGAEGMTKLSDSMSKTTAAEVAATRMDNLGGSIEQMKGSFETVMIKVGAPFLKMIRGFVDGITSLLNKFGGLPGPIQMVVVGGGLLIGVLAGLTGALMLGAVGVMKLKKGFQDMKAVMQMMNIAAKRQMIAEKARQVVTKIGTAIQWAFNAAMTANPIFLVIAAIAAIGLALFVLYKKFKPFRELIDKLWQAVQKAFDVIMDVVKGFIDWIKNNWDIILVILTGPFGLVILVVRRFGDDLINFFKKIPGKIAAVADMMFDWIWEKILGAYNFVSEKVEGIIEFFAELPGKLLSAGKAVFDWLMDKMTAAKDWIWEKITDFVGFFIALPGRLLSAAGNVFQWLIEKATAVKDWIWQKIQDIVGFYVGLPGRLLAVGGDIFKWIIDKMTAAKEWVLEKIGDIVAVIKGLPGKFAELGGGIWDFFYNSFKGVWNRIAKFIRGLDFTINVPDILPGPDEYTIGFPDLPDIKHAGGLVKGAGRDVLTQLQPGEFVLQKSAANALGMGTLNALNAGKAGGASQLAGDITIINPTGETAEESLFRTLQKVAYLGANA